MALLNLCASRGIFVNIITEVSFAELPLQWYLCKTIGFIGAIIVILTVHVH